MQELNPPKLIVKMKKKITLENIRKIFFLMEVEEKLFNLKTEDGQYIWNCCRYDIYNTIFSMYNDSYVESKIIKTTILLSIIKKIKQTLSRKINKIKNFMSLRYILIKRPDYIFITCQRTKIGECIEDSIVDHLIEIEKKKSLSIEIMNRNSISYIRMILCMDTRIPPVDYSCSMNQNSLLYFDEVINKSLNKYFGFTIEIIELLNYSFSRQRENFKYFSKIFLSYSPRAIIGVNDNNLNGLYDAAKKFKIPTVELQHGASNEHTILWSYPELINCDHVGLSLPDAYFTFSDYWLKNSNYPVKIKRTIGNDNLYQESVECKTEAVLIISTYVYHDALVDLAKELGEGVNIKIYFKLHPHEYHRKEETIDGFGKYKNIEVISNELNFDKLFNLCSHVVVVHSSTAYQALQSGKCVCVYMHYNYFFHSDIFEYVQLFKNTTELIEIINQSSLNITVSTKKSLIPLFYSRFKIREYKNALKELEDMSKS